ncbi:hypothetical protein GLOIN_2v1775922 [Rhizophagus clarus]|uniref:Uncharacterized protein n=1 Tax=Rhizophagus clarus TaxID=94130 RepID=A0A8H3M1L6_9GLOM|nr:hypothetical protein GLOIN_2v1775922 [Rhizophagus clarus]
MYLKIHNKYELKYMGNIDETSMWFDLPSNTTINQKGAKMSLILMKLQIRDRKDLIQRSFKSCGISINLDGSEDNCIGDYDSLLDRDNEMIKNSDDSIDENYEEYAEEVDYENKWNIEVDQKKNQEEDNDEDSRN